MTTQTMARGRLRYSLGLLSLIYMLNFVDRQIVNILAEPIKRDLGLSDTQLGLLTGLAFALFYTVVGLPIARLSDRINRSKVIAVSTLLWSLMTALCGLTQSFAQILLARVGVGVGEAGCTPAAHSLISDYVVSERRASALSIYSLGVPFGTLVGMAFGGWIGEFYGWRMAFILAGLPGIAVGIIAWLTLPEPRSTMPMTKAENLPSFSVATRELARNPVVRGLTLGASLLALLGYGQAAFLGSFFVRVHGMPLNELGLYLGLVLGLSGAAGTWIGGALVDRDTNAVRQRIFLVPAAGAALAVPFAVLAFTVTSSTLALALLCVSTLLNSLWFGPLFAALQAEVGPRTRAISVAWVSMCITLVGLGVGPVLVGLISDVTTASAGEQAGIRTALISTTPLGLVAAILLGRVSAGRISPRELERG